ncbi:arsenate reductase [Candidatus Endobugula sertula]|uniref:Arsenate reductase n=1 Tax=Candidatus Endobugula sertula TaxID=62101 RepID=A0A1D2QTI6_9GAMM|nr:arsenate reductase [Candidatus Endobugula sertula]
MITLFGIKNCDTIKKARRWLDAANIDYRFHDFRIDGINAEQVTLWIEQLGLEILVNKRSTTWKGLSESDKKNLDKNSAVALIVNNPTLIKRPLLEHNNSYTVGFKEAIYQHLFKV